MTKNTKPTDVDGFVWSPGALSLVNEDGSLTRIGEIPPEIQKEIERRKTEPTKDRSDCDTWSHGNVEIICRGSAVPLLTEKQLDAIRR